MMARLALMLAAAVCSSIVASSVVAFTEATTGRGLHPVETVILFVASLLGYLLLTVPACLVGAIVGSIAPRLSSPMALLMFAGIAVASFALLLREAIRSTQFYAPGGFWMPVAALSACLVLLLMLNRNHLYG